MLRAHLKTLRGQPPHAPLFRSPRGTRVSYDARHYQWGQVCTTAGLVDAQGKPRYTLHQLRHTHGSELVEHGHRMEIVQRVLGHRDPRSTQGYAALHDDQVRAALEQAFPDNEYIAFDGERLVVRRLRARPLPTGARALQQIIAERATPVNILDALTDTIR